MTDSVLGTGAHRYTWIDGWAKLPAGKAFGYTHGVCEDAQGRIFIHNQSEDAVAMFDADGQFLGSWGAEFKDGAHGMQYHQEDGGEFLYFCDIARRIVVKTDLDGNEVFRLEYPKESGVYAGPEGYCPTNVAVAATGDFYVADGYGSSYVHQYTAAGDYVRTWGGPGSEPGQMKCPHGIWIDTRGPEPLVLVADRANVRLQYFTLDGEFVRMTAHDLRHPCHFDQRGDELLIPDLFGRLTIFDGEDRLITHLGDNPGIEKAEGYPNIPHASRVPGRFISPHAAIWDRAGNIYVVEWISDGRVTKLLRA